MKKGNAFSELECLRCFTNMKPGKPDAFNETFSSLPALVLQQLKEEIKRNMQMSPQTLLNEMINTAATEARSRYGIKADECVKTFFSEKKYAKILKDRMVRARFVAYAAYCVIASCRGDDMTRGDKLLEMCGDFDYDKELTLDDWIVPMTGNLAVDVRANFVAKYVRKSGFESANKVFNNALNLSIEQIEENIRLQGHTNLIIPFFLSREMEFLNDNYNIAAEQLNDSKEKLDPNEIVLLFFKKSDVPHEKSIQHTNAFIYQQLLSLQSDEPVLWDAVHMSKLPFSGISPFNMGASYNPEYGYIDNRVSTTAKSVLGLSSVLTKKRYNAIADECESDSMEWTASFDELTTCADAGRLIDRERADILAAIKRRELMKEKDKEIERLKRELQNERAKNERLTAARSGKQQQLEDELTKQKEKYAAAVQHMDALEEKCTKLKKAASTAENQLSNAKKEAEATEKEIQALQQQTVSMYKEPVEDNDLDTSILDGLRIVCEGGHKSWIAGMQDLHPYIHFYGADDTPPADEVIRNADMVWIQPNSLSHPRFWRTSSIADQAGVPIRFFTYAGHKFCKQEMLAEIKKYFE